MKGNRYKLPLPQRHANATTHLPLPEPRLLVGVNALPTMLFWIDTGVAGAGAKLTQATIDRAGIHLEQKKASEGVGAGGTFRIVPYTIAKLSLGDFSEMNVPGIFDGTLPIATVLGFDVPGMIGHDALLRHSITFDFSSMRIIID